MGKLQIEKYIDICGVKCTAEYHSCDDKYRIYMKNGTLVGVGNNLKDAVESTKRYFQIEV